MAIADTAEAQWPIDGYREATLLVKEVLVLMLSGVRVRSEARRYRSTRLPKRCGDVSARKVTLDHAVPYVVPSRSMRGRPACAWGCPRQAGPNLYFTPLVNP